MITKDRVIRLHVELIAEQDALEPPPDGFPLQFRKHVELQDMIDRIVKLIDGWDSVPDKMLGEIDRFLQACEERTPYKEKSP